MDVEQATDDMGQGHMRSALRCGRCVQLGVVCTSIRTDGCPSVRALSRFFILSTTVDALVGGGLKLYLSSVQ